MPLEKATSNAVPGSQIDWTQAPFPSDDLTLGQLRDTIGCNHEALSVAVHNLALLEKEVAVAAFGVARCRGGEDDTRVRRMLKEDKSRELSHLYVEAGLAAGPKEATEMIRRWEAWAEGEAGKHVADMPR